MNAPRIPTKTIVVAVDMSETGGHALREAMHLTSQLPGAQLHIIHVVPVVKEVHGARKLDALSAELNERLEKLREYVNETCAPSGFAVPFKQEVVFHVRLGNPAEAIHQAAVDVDADLIVVGTHGRRGVEKLLLGSVAEALVRTAHVPVLVAHPKDYTGLRPSERPDALRPGEDLHTTGVSARIHLEFPARTAHISGLV